MYRLGQLNKKIKIERDKRVDDGFGGHTLQPVVFAEPYAYIRNKSTRELLQGQQTQSTGVTVIVIRNRDDLLPSDRITYGKVRFNIVGIPPYDSREAFLEIDCEYGVAT